MKTDKKHETAVQQYVVDTSALSVKHIHPDDKSKAVPTKVSKKAVKTATETRIEKQPRPTRLDPTRYGDWEKNGRCIDF